MKTQYAKTYAIQGMLILFIYSFYHCYFLLLCFSFFITKERQGRNSMPEQNQRPKQNPGQDQLFFLNTTGIPSEGIVLPNRDQAAPYQSLIFFKVTHRLAPRSTFQMQFFFTVLIPSIQMNLACVIYKNPNRTIGKHKPESQNFLGKK